MSARRQRRPPPKPSSAHRASPAACASPEAPLQGPPPRRPAAPPGAIELTREGYRDRYTIEVAAGTYREKLIVRANRPPITLLGMTPDVDGVLVQWSDCDGCNSSTDPGGEWFDQTLFVGAADFRAHNISFAGSRRHGSQDRDMALQVAADRAFFSNCRFLGSGADTLYAGGMDHRAYFENCYVNGTDDFLWGVGSAVWYKCTIVGSSTLTAHKGTQVDRNGPSLLAPFLTVLQYLPASAPAA